MRGQCPPLNGTFQFLSHALVPVLPVIYQCHRDSRRYIHDEFVPSLVQVVGCYVLRLVLRQFHPTNVLVVAQHVLN